MTYTPQPAYPHPPRRCYPRHAYNIHMRAASLIAAFVTGTLFASFLALAWTVPSSAPPNGNVSAPINVGATDQIKNAGLGLNSLAVFGNAILNGASRYLNFGTTAGSSGYGIRDNAGTLEFKNSDGNWQSMAGGPIKQLVTATYGVQTSVAGGTYQDTGLSATITPTSPTSKIIIRTDIPMGYGGTCNAGGAAYFNIIRNGVQIKEMMVDSVNCGNGAAAGNQYLYLNHAQVWVDSPGTTNPVTYKIQGKATSAWYFMAQLNNAPSTMVLEEI